MCYCMIKASSVLPWKSSVVFGNLQQFSENVQKRLSGPWSTFGESSESVQIRFFIFYFVTRWRFGQLLDFSAI